MGWIRTVLTDTQLTLIALGLQHFSAA